MNTIQEYWWLGGIASLIYTAFSIWWTVRANRRIAHLMLQAEQTEDYLDKTPTGHMRKAARWHA